MKIFNKTACLSQTYSTSSFPSFVDFYCPAAKLIVEVDGDHHYSSENIQKDKTRNNYLNNLGFTVLRISDRDIFKNFDSVFLEIFDHL